MSRFFSFTSDPTRPIPDRFIYFNWEQRQDFLNGKIKEDSPDSHTSTAHYYGYSADQEDNLNKYKYNPLTGVFTIDQINNEINDSAETKQWVRNLDFTVIVKPLVIKPIIHPFKIHSSKITPETIALLKQWASVRESIWESIGVYLSSFFDIEYQYDFSSAIKLWKMGLVPSFDGKIWRLHGEEKAEVLWEEQLQITQ